jgi:AbrB family looped-hinge helix DNA binding protein
MKRSEVFISQVIADGRITIPKNVRKRLGLKEGSYVRVEISKVEAG